MRYFEIAKPPARHILAEVDQTEAVPGEPVKSAIRKPLKLSPPVLVSDSLNQLNQPSRRRHLSTRRSR
jgi:hypothetical protein